ncbi:hypothetical protein BFL36_13950 [Clavibacter michiganensis]|uniref:GmrSD restriction endonucleases N-terminal domain-containing protein n=1 Tax=Clavibacter michiganensis TaxID=28447 RepID=A0A251Y4E6_9MICO|nr:DUF262 domain-containing protein [Clavibacter michiganensis]OUE19141.1 hypothetical protein BFL36_13950 [Clavibacter michiganensis]
MKLTKSDLQLETLVNRIRNSELDLQPNFQRGEVWDIKRKQRLVDTILREWYVPAIHVVIDTENSEVVLDGQQRLVAIREFFDGKVKINGFLDPSSPWLQQWHNATYDQLPPAVQRGVARFVIQVVTLTDYKPEEPNELFFRLNQSYNLTPSEKRNALHGAARDQVKSIVVQLTRDGLLAADRVGFSNGRLAYDDIIARCCAAIELGNLREHINNNVVEQFYRRGPFSARTITGILQAGHLLIRQIDTAGGRVKFNKGTLQTWLLYSLWATAETGPIPPTLLRDFELTRSALRKGQANVAYSSDALSSVVSLYDDRASYRVTDVSSVLSRDLAIHLFSLATYGTSPRRSSDLLMARLSKPSDEAFPTIITKYLALSSWGDPFYGETT